MKAFIIISTLLSNAFASANQEEQNKYVSVRLLHKVKAPFCTDSPSNWVDALGNTCSWYEELKRLRCSEASNFAIEGVSAKDVCCACYGGSRSIEPDEIAGFYHIQCRQTSTYVGLHDSGQVGSFLERTARTVIQLEEATDEDTNNFTLKFFTGDYLSFDHNNDVVAWSGNVGNAEIFQYIEISTKEVAFQNKNDSYLAIRDGVRAVSSSSNEGALFKLIKIIGDKELKGGKYVTEE